MITCPFCRSARVKTVGGNDNPFDKNPKKQTTICLDCGRTIATHDPRDVFKTPKPPKL